MSRLPPDAEAALERASASGKPLYLVGGIVRDALLHKEARAPQPIVRDLDLVTEGRAQALGEALQKALGGDLTCHQAFMTCTLHLGGLTVDIATAREETYPSPGSLPQVRRSTLERDLFRRDFTLNALAVRVKSPALIDLFGGLEDLERKQLRVLHPDSFADDPTRMLRGGRLAGRLGLTLHPDTAQALSAALAAGSAYTVSASRLKHELMLTLAEQQVAPALELMTRYGVLAEMFGFHLDQPRLAQLERLDARRRERTVPDESYLLLLLTSVHEDGLAEHAAAFGWPKRLLAKRQVLVSAERGELRIENEDVLDPALGAALVALDPTLEMSLERLKRLAERPKLRGRDVLDLGLPSGPEVGKVLTDVAKARADGRVDSFQAELDLAKTLVEQRLADPTRDQETS